MSDVDASTSPNLPAPESVDGLTGIARSAGLAALTRAAIALGRPLSPWFQAYTGSVLVAGQIAPPSWMLHVSRKGWERELTAQMIKARPDDSEQKLRADFREINEPYVESYRAAADIEDDELTADAELTLADVQIVPALEAFGTKSGGHQVPVLRVPLASVNAWWFVDGYEIKGRAARATRSTSFGILFPIQLPGT